MDITAAVLLVIAIYWIAKIFFILQKSLNEITKGMNSLDERLSKIESATQERSTTKTKE
jgi:hypothetical protein